MRIQKEIDNIERIKDKIATMPLTMEDAIEFHKRAIKKVEKERKETNKALGIKEKDFEKGFTGASAKPKKVTSPGLKKMHLSESMFEDVEKKTFHLNEDALSDYLDREEAKIDADIKRREQEEVNKEEFDDDYDEDGNPNYAIPREEREKEVKTKYKPASDEYDSSKHNGPKFNQAKETHKDAAEWHDEQRIARREKQRKLDNRLWNTRDFKADFAVFQRENPGVSFKDWLEGENEYTNNEINRLSKRYDSEMAKQRMKDDDNFANELWKEKDWVAEREKAGGLDKLDLDDYSDKEKAALKSKFDEFDNDEEAQRSYLRQFKDKTMKEKEAREKEEKERAEKERAERIKNRFDRASQISKTVTDAPNKVKNRLSRLGINIH